MELSKEDEPLLVGQGCWERPLDTHWGARTGLRDLNLCLDCLSLLDETLHERLAVSVSSQSWRSSLCVPCFGQWLCLFGAVHSWDQLKRIPCVISGADHGCGRQVSSSNRILRRPSWRSSSSENCHKMSPSYFFKDFLILFSLLVTKYDLMITLFSFWYIVRDIIFRWLSSSLEDSGRW